jgi:hypothetical protein
VPFPIAFAAIPGSRSIRFADVPAFTPNRVENELHWERADARAATSADRSDAARRICTAASPI